MAAYVDVMEKKMDSVLQELVTVKDQFRKIEEQEAEKGLETVTQKGGKQAGTGLQSHERKTV